MAFNMFVEKGSVSKLPIRVIVLLIYARFAPNYL